MRRPTSARFENDRAPPGTPFSALMLRFVSEKEQKEGGREVPAVDCCRSDPVPDPGLFAATADRANPSRDGVPTTWRAPLA